MVSSVWAKAFLPRLSEGSLRCMGEPMGIPSSQNLVTFSFTEKVNSSCRVREIFLTLPALDVLEVLYRCPRVLEVLKF